MGEKGGGEGREYLKADAVSPMGPICYDGGTEHEGAKALALITHNPQAYMYLCADSPRIAERSPELFSSIVRKPPCPWLST